jgi:hypothetical protein
MYKNVQKPCVCVCVCVYKIIMYVSRSMHARAVACIKPGMKMRIEWGLKWQLNRLNYLAGRINKYLNVQEIQYISGNVVVSIGSSYNESSCVCVCVCVCVCARARARAPDSPPTTEN